MHAEPIAPPPPPKWPYRIALRTQKGVVRAWAVLDQEDYVRLWRYSWAMGGPNRSYASSNLGLGRGPRVWMHRVIMGLTPGDGLEVDHINGDRLDNRRSNLRVVTRAQNQQNKCSRSGSRSQYRGVSWIEGRRKWRAGATFQGKAHYFGMFDDEHEAGRAAAEGRARLMTHAVDR